MKTSNDKRPRILFDAKILVNGLSKNHNRSGIFFVAYNLLLELQRQDFFEISLLFRHIKKKLINVLKDEPFLSTFDFYSIQEREVLRYNIKVHRETIKGTHNIFVIITRSIKIIKNIIKWLFFVFFNNHKKVFNDIDIYLSPGIDIPPCIKEIKRIKRFIVLHDTIPYLTGYANKEAWFLQLLNSLDPQTYCFCVSECTKNDFLKAIPAQLDKEKMFVTYNATSQQFTPDYNKEKLKKTLEKYGIEQSRNNYIFSLCSIDPRKNLIFTVTCFIKFIQKHNINNLYFYLGGGHFESFIDQFNKKMRGILEYSDKIIRLGYVDDEDVNILYSNSLFFTCLSQYEGFGMPPLEAMQAGTPVITSNNSSLPEVVGDAAIMIDYDSEEQCIKAFEDLYFNEDLRKQYIKKGFERAKLFSWEKTVDKMIDVIIKVIEG